MVALANNKAWFDKAFVSVSAKGGNDVQLRAKTTSLSITGGGFDIEGIETFGGKIKRVGTRDDIEVSFDGIAVSVQDFDWIFHGLTTNTASAITSSDAKDFRLVFLWTDETGITSANQAIATASEAYRQEYVDANCTSLEYNMDAGEHLTATMAFKLPYEDDTGGVNFKKQIADTSTALVTTSAYTSTNKF